MKLYQWKISGITLLVIADNIEAARTAMISSVEERRHQNPPIFDVVLKGLRTYEPYSVTPPGHVITLVEMS